MNDIWAEKFVDNKVERAWLELRMLLADRFAEGLATGEMAPVNISTATGETLTVIVEDDHVVVVAGEDITATENVDEAAYQVFHVLRDEWQVVHPVFLDSEIVEVPQVPDNPIKVVVPAMGRAESREQLQTWVEASFQEGMTEQLKVGAGGYIAWRTPSRHRITVKVRNAGRIELTTVLARQVSFKKAKDVIADLSREYFGLKFLLVQDTIVMSQTLVATPFVAEQLKVALRHFSVDADRLAWVAEKVLRKRIKVERVALAEAEEATAKAEAGLADAEARLAAEELRLARRDRHYRLQVTRLRQGSLAAARERDEAVAELARIKRLMERALDRNDFPA